jgi:PAT family beta-lactamase induction signal transducer AmpG
MQTSQAKSPWLWVPSLYFGQAIPYVVAMTCRSSCTRTWASRTPISRFYTSLLYLPWVIKPLWSPVVDMFGTKRAGR